MRNDEKIRAAGQDMIQPCGVTRMARPDTDETGYSVIAVRVNLMTPTRWGLLNAGRSGSLFAASAEERRHERY
jgi:hypothetical protein